MGDEAPRFEGESLPTHRAGVRFSSTCAFAVLAAVLATLVVGAPAQAFLHRGHVFAGSLETSGENKLSSPSAVAVNEKSEGNGAGDVYVLDKGNNRVVRFGPNHEFLEAWGVGVDWNASSLAFDGLLKPVIFLTNCSDAARTSSSVTGGSKLKRFLIFLHIGPPTTLF